MDAVVRRKKFAQFALAFVGPLDGCPVAAFGQHHHALAGRAVQPVGHGALRGKPGPVYARLHEAYERAKLAQSI